MDALSLKICDIQGRLFELSTKKGLDSHVFVSHFMKSKLAENMDATFNHMQWAGEEYLLEALIDEVGNDVLVANETFDEEVMYWIGYIYRYWHFYTGESSKKIVKQANINTMRMSYNIFHTFDPALAVDELKELYMQKR